ncbi:MAG: tryptophan 7-halogenase [Thalassotalea sp.]
MISNQKTEQQAKPNGNLAILGLSVDALLAALHLKHSALGQTWQISVIGELSPNKVSLTSLCKDQLDLLRELDSQFDNFLRKTKASYTTTNKFIGWSEQDFYIPQQSGLDIFHQPTLFEISKLRRQGYNIAFQTEAFYFGQVLAEQGRFPLSEKFPFDLDYHCHIDSKKLQHYLLTLLTGHNITLYKEQPIAVNNDDKGNVTAIKTPSCTINIDLLINLNSKTEHSNFSIETSAQIKLNNIRTNNAKLVIATKHQHVHHDSEQVSANQNSPHQTSVIALSNGYAIKTPSEEGFVFHYYFNDSRLSKVQAETELTALIKTHNSAVNTLEVSAAVCCPHEVYISQTMWKNNVIALGDSYSQLEPLNHCQNYLSFHTLTKIIEVIDANAVSEEVKKQFNQVIQFAYLDALTFYNALYLFNGKQGNDYWNTPQDQSLAPQLLLPVIQQWFSGQDIQLDARKVFHVYHEVTWYSLFSGLNLSPPAHKNYENIEQINDDIAQISALMAGCALNFPTAAALINTLVTDAKSSLGNNDE